MQKAHRDSSGRRAFSGETAPMLHIAILENTPKPAEELNPGVSPDLARIIDRALRKDRSSRYQSVAEMRTDRENLSRKSFRRWFPASIAIPIAGAVVLAAISLACYVSQPSKAGPAREFRQCQLTASSSDDPVTGGAISPDGKYLVYTDLERNPLEAGGEWRDGIHSGSACVARAATDVGDRLMAAGFHSFLRHC